MRVFVAGATGAVGKNLMPLLAAGGHRVAGTTRTPAKVDALRALGAEAVVVDGLDRDGLLKAITSFHPDVVVHEMTALASLRSFKHMDDEFAQTNLLRTKGTEYLLAAAQAAGARRFVAQSYASWPNQREGNRVRSEDAPFELNLPKTARKTQAAMRTLENMVVSAIGIEGIVLRYGSFYGPGTSLAGDGEFVKLLQQRKFPLVGNAAGVWSFIHIEDAARATQIAIERGPGGIFQIVDDEPAEVSVWLPYLAEAVGAPPPRRVPAWIARFFVGEAGVSIMTKARGSTNAKAKRLLNWQPIYASWRDGFQHGLSDDHQQIRQSFGNR